MAAPLSVALLGSRTLGAELGKKGTASDITLYNSTGEGRVVTYVEPTQFPEKFPPLMNALFLGERVILSVEAINRELAESAVTVDLVGRKEGLVALAGSVGKEEFLRAIRGTVLEQYPIVPMDSKDLRRFVDEWPETPVVEGDSLIPIDHAFPVRGVGTVVLGFVRRGTVRLHQKFALYPEEKGVEVKSMQVHDMDVTEAGPGQRVGLALKGVEVEDVRRGQVLAVPGSLRVSDILELHGYRACPFFKGKAGEGEKVHISLGLQVLPAKVSKVDGTTITVQLAQPAVCLPGEKAYLLQLSGAGAGPRIAGGGLLVA